MAAEGKGVGAFVRNVPEFISQVQAERRKVSWPTFKETWVTGLMVVIMTTLLGLFFFGMDQFFSHLVQFLLSLLG